MIKRKIFAAKMALQERILTYNSALWWTDESPRAVLFNRCAAMYVDLPKRSISKLMSDGQWKIEMNSSFVAVSLGHCIQFDTFSRTGKKGNRP